MSEVHAPTEPSRLKYLLKTEIMREVAAMVGISDYDPSRVSDGTRHACFTKDERRQIFEALTDDDHEITEKDSSELLRKELTPLIMRAIGEELDSGYIYEFTRTDLQKIHQALAERQSE